MPKYEYVEILLEYRLHNVNLFLWDIPCYTSDKTQVMFTLYFHGITPILIDVPQGILVDYRF